VAFLVWIPLACLVWLLAGVLALNRGTRRQGLALALAMAVTFPSVFLFQAAAAPLIVAMIVGLAWLSGVLDTGSVTHSTTNGLVIAMSIGTTLLAVVIMLAMSILGFVEGWLLGWRCAHGEHFRNVIGRGPTARLLRRLGLRKPHYVL
jgi:hypothetical protein